MQIVFICITLAIVIFIVDIASLPLGVAAGVAYVGVVLISLWFSQWQMSLLIALVVSFLTLLGLVLSEPSGIGWMVIANRLLALLAIWLTAIVGGWWVFSKRKRSEQALIQARSETARARDAKLRFLESTSNEMRQHLQTMTLLSATLHKTTSDEKQKKICEMQNDAVDRLGELLTSILEYSELETGEVKPKLAEVPIAELFGQLQTEFASQAQAKGLKLNFSANEEHVVSDKKLLTRVLRSLISNAIRYTNEGVTEVSCDREPGGLKFIVRDTGIGIPPDKLDVIFDEFYRVDNNPVDRNAGRGLGLAIVDRSLGLLQSKIRVESELGRGSSFSFVLPSG